MEFNIAKIIDGVFVGNNTALNDFDFILNNKISHIVIWSQNQCYLELQGVQKIYLHKQQDAPTLHQIKQTIQALQSAKQQYLCCFISCQFLYQALVLLIPFFVDKFQWSVNTTANFFSYKIAYFQISNMNNLLSNIMSVNKNWPFRQQKIYRNIIWTQSFLQNLQLTNSQQILIVNTIKNIIVKPPSQTNKNQQKVKKKKRIQWHDRIPKNPNNTGQRLFGTCRINNYGIKRNCNNIVVIGNRSLQKAKQGTVLTSSTTKSYQRVNSAKKITKVSTGLKQNNFDDFDYLGLKDLSRTNFDDYRLKSSKMRKRGSMKNLKIQEDKVIIKRRNFCNQNICNLKKKQNSNKFLTDLKKMGYYTYI